MRPFTTDEIKDGKNVSCITVDSDTHVTLRKAGGQGGAVGYTFNTVLGPSVTQEELFARTVMPYIDSFLQGTPALIFCYGVTNAGKTFTISGTPESPGIVPRTLETILAALHAHSPAAFKAAPPPAPAQPQSQLPPPGSAAHAALLAALARDANSSGNTSTSGNTSSGSNNSSGDRGSEGDAVPDELTYSTSSFAVSAASSLCASVDVGRGSTAPARAPVLDARLHYALAMSYLEVYNDNVYDLLADAPSSTSPALFNRNGAGAGGGGCGLGSGVGNSGAAAAAAAAAELVRNREALAIVEARGQTVVRGLRSVPVASVAEGVRLLAAGARSRISANTQLNTSSSRSHAVVTFRLAAWPRDAGATLAAAEARAPALVRHSQISVVDLAGSERAERTNNTGAQLSQASNINNSLMTFRRCVQNLQWNQRNPRCERPVPFRECKLTRLFHDFFVGTGRAMMVVNVSPSVADYSETTHVLAFGTLAREVLLPNNPATTTTTTTSGFSSNSGNSSKDKDGKDKDSKDGSN